MISTFFTDRSAYVPALRPSQRHIYELRQPGVPQDYGGPVRSREEWLRTGQQAVPEHGGRRGESANSNGVHPKYTKQP